jgi:hypothetical protein
MAARYPDMDMTPYLGATQLQPDRSQTVSQRLGELRTGSPLETGAIGE